MDSSATKTPFVRWGAMALPVSMMNEISGSRFLLSGVGTQMMTASTSLIRLKSVAAEKVLACTAPEMDSGEMCLM